jgi:hypothetical protein
VFDQFKHYSSSLIGVYDSASYLSNHDYSCFRILIEILIGEEIRHIGPDYVIRLTGSKAQHIPS